MSLAPFALFFQAAVKNASTMDHVESACYIGADALQNTAAHRGRRGKKETSADLRLGKGEKTSGGVLGAISKGENENARQAKYSQR